MLALCIQCIAREVNRPERPLAGLLAFSTIPGIFSMQDRVTINSGGYDDA
jgi:hypothetical protein